MDSEYPIYDIRELTVGRSIIYSTLNSESIDQLEKKRKCILIHTIDNCQIWQRIQRLILSARVQVFLHVLCFLK